MKLGVVLGIVSDKIVQMSGAPQLRMEVNVKHDHSDLIEKLNAAQALMRQAEGQVIEAESGTVAGDGLLVGSLVCGTPGPAPAAVPASEELERRAA